MKIKINAYHHGPDPVFKRYTGSDPVPGYDDITQLWVLQNTVQNVIDAVIDGKRVIITRTFKQGLIIDKASTPGESSDWYPAVNAVLGHDTDFSCHYLARYAVPNGDGTTDDDGFRATNLIFMVDIDWHILDAVRRRVVSRFRGMLWHIKKRLWYRAVNSIAGQGRYENGDPSRGNHGELSGCEVEVMG
jgi:hypothetical protein